MALTTEMKNKRLGWLDLLPTEEDTLRSLNYEKYTYGLKTSFQFEELQTTVEWAFQRGLWLR